MISFRRCCFLFPRAARRRTRTRAVCRASRWRTGEREERRGRRETQCPPSKKLLSLLRSRNEKKNAKQQTKKKLIFTLLLTSSLTPLSSKEDVMAAAASPPSSSLPSPPPLSSSDPQPETQQEEEENSSPLETSSSSISSLAAAAALVVDEAEAPLRWAPPRERWALRKLPQSKEMGRERLEQLLKSAFEASPALREELGGEVLLLLSLSSSKKKSGGKQEEKETRRCLAACLRSAAFLAAGDWEQALRVSLSLCFSVTRGRETKKKGSLIRNSRSGGKNAEKKNERKKRTPEPPSPGRLPTLLLPRGLFSSAPPPLPSWPRRSRPPGRKTPRHCSNGFAA